MSAQPDQIVRTYPDRRLLTNVRLGQGQIDWLHTIAEETGRNRSEVIRAALVVAATSEADVKRLLSP